MSNTDCHRKPTGFTEDIQLSEIRSNRVTFTVYLQNSFTQKFCRADPFQTGQETVASACAAQRRCSRSSKCRQRYSTGPAAVLQEHGSTTSQPEQQLMTKLKAKGAYSSFTGTHLTATGHHLPYGITQCYLPPDTSERARLNPQPARPVLDLPTREGRKADLT